MARADDEKRSTTDEAGKTSGGAQSAKGAAPEPAGRYVSPDVDSGQETGRPDPVSDSTGQLGATAAKYDVGGQDDLLLDALGELPPGYDQTYLSLAARDPEWLFAYWDVNDPDMVAAAEKDGWDRLTLRVHQLGGPSTDIKVGPRGGRWYVKVTAPDKGYYAELGLTLPEGRFRRFAVSNQVRTPPAGPAADAPPAFATLPWGFDRERIAGDECVPPADEKGPDERLRERIERASPPAEPHPGGKGSEADPPAHDEPDEPSANSPVPSGGENAPNPAPPRDNPTAVREPGPEPGPADARVYPKDRTQAPSSDEPPPGVARRQAPSSGGLQAPSSSTGRPRGD